MSSAIRLLTFKLADSLDMRSCMIRSDNGMWVRYAQADNVITHLERKNEELSNALRDTVHALQQAINGSPMTSAWIEAEMNARTLIDV